MKIGILTHYYNSENYGGMLQAFALTTFLCRKGFDAEQICYQWVLEPMIQNDSVSSEPKKRNEVQSVRPMNEYSFEFGIFTKIRNSLYARLIENPKWREIRRYEKEYLKLREMRNKEFQNRIPHSEKIYTPDTISEAIQYNCYITGSDQVWNFDWFNEAFFLTPFPKEKKKISYAASAGNSTFSSEECDYLRRILPTFDAISVREESLVGILNELNSKKCTQLVLDPVFLLRPYEWSTIAKKRIVRGRYIFTYFLGQDDRLKNLAKEYARRKHRKIVSIPYLFGFDYKRQMQEYDYADKNIPMADPIDFVNLIKYADCVITDSFHAVAFSIMFKRNFFVFPRFGAPKMQSRIESVVHLAKCDESFCKDLEQQTVSYMLRRKQNINFNSQQALEDMRISSEKFLIESLK